jgi:hypothetical protein
MFHAERDEATKRPSNSSETKPECHPKSHLCLGVKECLKDINETPSDDFRDMVTDYELTKIQWDGWPETCFKDAQSYSGCKETTKTKTCRL